jgi:flavin reductase (DIM6/NTAB) family NADH-FMN oxidoreductase RutF
MIDLDFSKLTEYQRYKLMASLIIPRPIALVTTIGDTGVVNAAPFSMFNMLGEEPPIVMISINKREDGMVKDTARNILARGEFVVHLVDEAIAQQMHRCGDYFPPDVSEVETVGFTTVPSLAVSPPRIAEAPVSLECTLYERLETPSRHIFIGQIRWMHARDDLIDVEKYRVHLHNYFPIARFGASFYTRTRDRFAIEKDLPHSTEAPGQDANPIDVL